MKPSEQAIQTAINTLKAAGYGITPPQDLGVWKDAPEWAEYRATDYDGGVFWHETKPLISEQFLGWHSDTNTDISHVIEECKENWKDSLIKRPR